MEVFIVVPIYGCTILAALFLLVFIFDAATNGISGETMEAFANEYTIYFAIIFALIAIAITLYIYKDTEKKRSASIKTCLKYFTYWLFIFTFLCTLYIWVIASIWNLFDFLGMGLIVFLMGFPISAIIYLLIGAAVVFPIFMYFFELEKPTTKLLVRIILSVIYCYVMYVFDFFSFFITSCS